MKIPMLWKNCSYRDEPTKPRNKQEHKPVASHSLRASISGDAIKVLSQSGL